MDDKDTTDSAAFGLDRAQFDALAAQGYNRIPLWLSVPAGMQSPLSLYSRLSGGPNSVLLESDDHDDGGGRYSIVGLAARYCLQVREHQVAVLEYGKIVERGREQDPLAWVESFLARFRLPEDILPAGTRHWGGLYGYFGYDTVRYIEPRLEPGRQPSPTGIADIRLSLCDELAVLDHHQSQVLLLVYLDPAEADFDEGARRLKQMQAQLDEADPTPPFIPQGEAQEQRDKEQWLLRPHFGRDDYDRAIGHIRDYIYAGDCMQVVLASSFTADLQASPLDFYRSLRMTNPSPYMYFLDCGDFHIAGSSPEELCKLEGDKVLLRPIAGTRRRGRDAEEDRALAEEMLNDPKEIAEHVMLVDLGRNDLGRVAEPGTVKVQEYLTVRRYRNIMHLVSTVEGRVKPDQGAIDLLRATFPAGTLSGAPKVRAMEIIDELEPVGRGLYSGGIGYISYGGEMSLAIAIRTAVLQNGKLHATVGGGIVADSTADSEWLEIHNKARGMEKTLLRVTGKQP